jgi:hypothetical protein
MGHGSLRGHGHETFNAELRDILAELTGLDAGRR